jgi:hypothetical protein
MVISKIYISIEDYIYYLPQTAPTVNMKGGGAYVLINPNPVATKSKNQRRT